MNVAGVCKIVDCWREADRRGLCRHHLQQRDDQGNRRGSGWQGTRERVMARTNGYCERCNEPATVVHHVVPKADGGTDALANLEALCRDCHRHAHA